MKSFAEKKEKKEKEKQNKEKKQEESTSVVVKVESIDPQINKPGYLCLYGEINEENSHDIINSLLYLHKTAKSVVSFSTSEGEKLETVEVIEPIEVYVCTSGGSASDMFAVYDIMQHVQEEDTEVITIGVGKVMSAGVLILACGTKGKRRIGKNCRVMIHGVVAGQHGQLHDIENEMEEVRWIQDRYIQALSENSDMTKKYIKKLLDRKVNVYLDAKEVIELGIADELI